jgi:methyl-accepting chemotaxis protein
MGKMDKIKNLSKKIKIDKSLFQKINLKNLKEFSANQFTIKFKIIAIVFIFSFISTVTFTYSMYSNTKKAIIPSLNKHTKAVAYGAHIILKEYQNQVKSSKSISIKQYDKMVEKLSEFARKSDVKKIYTVIKYKDDVVYTSTSTKFIKDEKNKQEDKLADYSKYFDVLEKPNIIIKTLLDNKSNELRFNLSKDLDMYTHSLYVPFENRNGIKYIIAVDIEADYINMTLNNLAKTMILIGLIKFILLLAITISLITIIFKKFNEIELVIKTFFKYINKETGEPKYITYTPIRDDFNDEFSKLSKMINENISLSVKNVKQDDVMLNDMQKVSNSISRGIFKYKIDTEANSPILNESKDMMNKMFESIQNVVFEISKIADEYSKLNFKAKIKTESYDDTFLQMAEGINSLGVHFSKEVKESASSSIDIQNGSNDIRTFIEEIKVLFETIIAQANKLLEYSEDSEKFNSKLQYKINETIEEKEYVSKVITKIKNESNHDDIKDIELSLYKFVQNLTLMNKELEKQSVEIKNNRQPLNLLKNIVKENQEMSDIIIKLSSELSLISNKIRESVEQTNFEGKNEISIMMQNIDR